MSANLADPTPSKKMEINLLFIGLKGSGKTTSVLKTVQGCPYPQQPKDVLTFCNKVEYKDVVYYLLEVTSGDTADEIGFDLQLTKEPIHGLIYVVDSSNRRNIEEAKQYLIDVLQKKESNNIPLQVLANKQDLPDAMTAEEITDKLGLHELENRRWNVKATVAVSESGRYDTLEWLSTQI